MRTSTNLLLSMAVSLTACGIDVPDLNNPGLDDLENNPTPSKVAAAATGLLIQDRAGFGAENGYVVQLGILGREAFNFDSADPRFVGELLEGPLSSGSPFGGAFWPSSYSNERNANILLHALDKVEGLSDEQLSGIRGFSHTIMALDLLVVIDTHDTNGIVIDTDKSIDELGAIVDKPTGMAAIASLLDNAVAELSAAGDTFAFQLSAGYAGFDDPAGFLKFNRALRARVAIYTGDYAMALTALGGSFIDDSPTGDLHAGVFHVFGTSSGDTANALINPNIFAHPSLQTDAQMKANAMPDDRFTNKVTTADKPGSEQDHTSTLAFTLYPAPNSPIPIIRNEELILIKAEALKNTADLPGAITEINLIRTTSGGLAARADLNATNFDDELLYNRRYSLMFEGGHRWIDLRRFNRLGDLPLDVANDVRNARYPIPLNECNARPGEARCLLGSD